MIGLLLALELVCPKVKIINHSKEWTQRDQRVVDTNKCIEYFINSPCLYRAIKSKSGHIHLSCGPWVEKK